MYIPLGRPWHREDWLKADIFNSKNYAGWFRKHKNIKWSLKRYSEAKWESTGIPYFIGLHRCWVFYKLKARPSTSKNIMACFILILVLLRWSGTQPTISLRCASNQARSRESNIYGIQKSNGLEKTPDHLVTTTTSSAAHVPGIQSQNHNKNAQII